MRTSQLSELPEVAFYYPGPMWRASDWVKSLILFFDGVALLVPDHIHDRPFQDDPVMATALEHHNLLHLLSPEKIVDKRAAEQLTEVLAGLITSGAFDRLRSERTPFHELSMSRLGFSGDWELAEMIFEELKARGLARDSEDGLSIPMHPMVRTTVLVLLSQILRPHGHAAGLDLCPATDVPALVNGLAEILAASGSQSVGDVVSFDLNIVGVDLGSYPIDEILDFRKAHLREHRRYARAVKRFARELSSSTPQERLELFEERQQELDDLASDLRRVSRKAWRKPASLALTLAGAVLPGAIGAALNLGSSALGGDGAAADPLAYTYLFQAQTRFGRY